MKVRIKKVPQARTGYQVHGALANDVPAMGGADYDGYASPETKFNRTLKAVPRDKANLEAEGRETAMVNTGNIPAFYTISGPRHSNGGVPLNLPDDSFIFSDFREMKIKDPDLLAKFGKSVKGKKAYTPAQISKQYDINKYREILQNPDSDAIDRKTAEIMIRNYNMKLGALALAQESKKGFPQGIPEVAKPFMEANGLSEEDFVPQEEEEMATEPGMEAEGEEMLAEENQAPETMPDGSPVAMPQGEPIPQEGMMQYGGYPMAMYGMQMGGYDMPYYPNQMAYGGVPRYTDGGGKKTGRKQTKEELKTRIPKDGKVKVVPKAPEGYEDLGGGYYGTGELTGGNKLKPTTGKVSSKGFNMEAYMTGVCGRMKNGDLKGWTADEVINGIPDENGVIQKFFHPGYEKIEDVRKQLRECETIEENVDIVKVEATPVNEEECECEYPDGSTERMLKNADGTCPPCKKEIEEATGDYGAEMAMPEGYAPWWLQDQVNMVGAMADKASLREYGPYYAAVEMEQPEYEYYDPTRALGAIGEQANIASQSSNQFAGSAQQAGARLQNIQGTAAEQAVNTESNYADKNLTAGNQEEAAQVNMRNQENMAKADVANKLYEGKVIANQNIQNAVRAANAAIRMGYSTAVGNRWKTDAMNQMYPDYAVDPSAGGQMYFNPTPKTPNPIKDKDVIAYAQQLEQAGLTKEERAVLLKEYVRSGNAASSGPDPEILQAMYTQRGGFMKNGGLVYADTVFPFII